MPPPAIELPSPSGCRMWQLTPTKLSAYRKHLRSSVLPSDARCMGGRTSTCQRLGFCTPLEMLAGGNTKVLLLLQRSRPDTVSREQATRCKSPLPTQYKRAG